MTNHSCEPNAHAVVGFPGTLKAIKEIPEGEEVTISYGKKISGFRCQCDRCARRSRNPLRAPSSVGSTVVDAIWRTAKAIWSSPSSKKSRVDNDDDEDEDEDGEDHDGDSSDGDDDDSTGNGWLRLAGFGVWKTNPRKGDPSSEPDGDSKRPAGK